MVNSRQPKLKPALRLCAALSVLIWLSATSYCSLEFLIGHPEGEHHAGQAATHDAAQSHGESGHSQDSDNNGSSDESCCSTLQAPPLTAGTPVLLKPDFGKLASFHFLWLARTLTLDAPETTPPRQAQHRDWIFTPEVSLGPAYRSHAPPSFS
jgi:hypothetical protein